MTRPGNLNADTSAPSRAVAARVTFDREAMQHAVNAFADVVTSLPLTPRQAEIGKAIIRAGIRKLNAQAAAERADADGAA